VSSALAFALVLIPSVALVGLLFLLLRSRSVRAGMPGVALDEATELSVLDEMADGVLLADHEGRLSYMNPAARQVLGLANLSLPAPLEKALRYHEDILALLSQDSGPGEGGEGATRSIELVDDQSRRAFDVDIASLVDAVSGRRTRLLVMRDVTDRDASERQLRLSELGLRQIIDLFPHLIYARDRSGRFLMANVAGAEAFGAVPQDLVGRTLSDLGLPKETIAKMLGQDQKVIDTCEEQHFDVKHPTAEGETCFQTTKIPFCFPESGQPAVLSIAVDVTERLRTEERIRALAFYDSLTGLPNRRRFQRLLSRSLETARRRQGQFALLFLDLDRFKEVNDRLGHSTGDHLLRDVAERLRDSVRLTDELAYVDEDDPHSSAASELASTSNEAVSRLAGDEFTILLTDVDQPISAGHVATRIIEAMSRPFFVGREEVFITASIGIAMYPDDGLGSDALLRCADQAMYEAKRAGPNRYKFFDPSMNEVAARRHAIHLHLHSAIENNELSLVYQQIRTAASGRICGCEALLRWQSAELGTVNPEEFIPVAEETRLIGEIGHWVFETACRQHAAWREEGLEPVRIAINVSPAQLQVAGFAGEVQAVMEATGVSPEEVEFELTETAVLAEDRHTDENLRRLAEMGVALTLDDFGTGQSSLSCLRRFAFSHIKIDRSFVAEIPGNRDDAKLTDAIIAMAHGLGLSVVAEGVETEEQLHFLRNHGCDELQGYLFARPESAADLALHLESDKSTS
jgi:PAS domain S-box-containing protein